MSALHAHSSVTEDAAAPYLAVSKKAYDPNTENLVLSARGLHPGPKAVLAHVCQLYEHGGFFCYNANNQYIATSLGITEPMASRHVHALAERGLLLISPRQNGHKRTLTPAPSLQAAYRSKSVAQITELVKSASESGKKALKSGKNSESGKMSDESGKKDFTSSVKRFYQFGKHIIISLEEKKLLTSKIAELENLLLAANAAIQKKEDDRLALEKRIEKATGVFKAQQKEITDLKAQLEEKKIAGPARTKKAKAADPLAGKGTLLIEAYQDWYRRTNNAAPAPPDAADQVGARRIYTTLLAQPNTSTDEEVITLFGALLQNWPKLDSFLQRQQKLAQIAANLTNILPQLIHHDSPTSSLNPANRPGLIPANEYANARAACKALGL